MKLGRLKKVDLRVRWQHEALDFTRWLAEEENLELLSDEIGIGIELVQTEASVGRFNVDILAREENTGKTIVIENQLESTDHRHLGQIITYAAGLEAEYILWLVKDVADEHKQAVDWLNEHTDEHLNFFLIKVELWQIGESDPAPKFSVVCRPNDWAKTVRSSAQEGTLTETKTMQLEFWQKLRAWAVEHKPDFKLRTPRPQHWFDIAIGRSDCHATFTLNTREENIGCEIYIPDSKILFSQLLAHREQIEQELGINPDWQELPNKKASRIRVFYPFDADKDDWEVGFAWLVDTGIKFKKAFGKNWGTT